LHASMLAAPTDYRKRLRQLTINRPLRSMITLNDRSNVLTALVQQHPRGHFRSGSWPESCGHWPATCSSLRAPCRSRWFLFQRVRKPGHCIRLDGGVEPFGAHVVHARKRNACACDTPSAPVNVNSMVRSHFPKNCAQTISPTVPRK